MKKSLPSSEWVLVLSLVAVMASLFIIAKVNAYRACSSFPMTGSGAERVRVTIDGSVAKPGEYVVPLGTPLECVLRKARPKPWADLQKFPLEQGIKGPVHLHVEDRTEITVSVCGAVAKPVDLTLPAKSRISDLRVKVSLTEDADKGFFKRKRMLKHGEIIEVPKKTVE